MKKPTKVQWIIIAVCLILMFGGQYFVPSFLGLSQQGVAVACIFVSTLALYCCVDVVWPTIALIMACITNGLYSYTAVTTLTFGNWVAVYCLFTTLISYALTKSGFVRRIAILMISNKFAQKTPRNFVMMFLLVTTVVVWFVDPVTALVVMTMILGEVFAILGIKKGDRVGRDLMFGVLVMDCIGCSATPISHVNAVLCVNMLTNDYGIPWNTLNFSGWGIIMSLIFLAIYLVYFFAIAKPDLSAFENVNVSSLKDSLEPMSKKERYVVIVYALTVFLWIAPGLLSSFLPTFANFISGLGLAFPCYLATILLVLAHDENGEPYLNLADGLKNGVAWVVVFLAAGCMILGSMMTNADFGVMDAIKTALGPVFGNMSPWVVLIVGFGMVCILTNFCSNTVTETMLYAFVVPMIMAGTITGINAMAMCAVTGLACNFAIMTPVAAGHTAVFSGSGWCDLGDQFKMSIPIVAFGIIFCTFIAYPLATIFF